MKKVKRQSAGILLYRIFNSELQVLLVHYGGPFWKDKDEGSWSIPKGEYAEPEMPLQAAVREFGEETGTQVQGPFIPLEPIVQKGGKQVHAWAAAGNLDADNIVCNTFSMQWPPKSGQWQSFPEVDKAAWYSIEEATIKINPAQVPFLDQLVKKL
ncbi:MAG: NUDIX domain-containing protein, partial [Chitinophagaceae bacterium]